MHISFFFRDYIDSGSVDITPDSGGECGIPYETYFPMPTPAKDKSWYSIEQASAHFTVISTEHDWSPNSEQVRLIKRFYIPYIYLQIKFDITFLSNMCKSFSMSG